MRRTLPWILVSLFLVSACGSAPKHAKVEHSKRHSKTDLSVGDSQFHRRSSSTSEDESMTLEDIIYDSLGHKRGTGVRYARGYEAADGKFDIPITDNEYVQKWIDYFTGRGREHFARYLARSGRFIPYMHAVLQKYGVPKDLVYLSMIESGFNTRANSWASAVGPWQFIKSTGALYGLNVDYYVDERRDVEKSTHAAAQHLRDLHDEFGDWYLAFAAYNAGAGKVRNAISRDGNNFWDMVEGNYLRQETKDYVPKILAAAIISKNPAKYGFREVEYQAPIDYEKVKMSSPTDLEVAAECAGVDADLVRLLNSELLQDMTPPHIPGYALKIPRGTRDRFMRKYAMLTPTQRMRSIEYVVARGDSLDEIAGRFGVSEGDIAKANPDEVDVRNEKRSEKVKVVGRHGHVKWEKRTYTVARYEVSSGSRLTIPRGRNGSATDSMRDDAAAHAAKDRFGLDVASLENPQDEKGKGKKNKNNKKEKLKPEPEPEVEVASRQAPLPVERPATHPDEDLAIEGDPYADRTTDRTKVASAEPTREAEPAAPNREPGELATGGTATDAGSPGVPDKNNADHGTPLEFKGRPEGTVPATAAAPSDAQLQQAVENVRKTDDLAVAPGEAEQAPAADSTAPAARTKSVSYHTVRRGETLASIADKYGVSAADLKEWNAKRLKGGLKAGTKLTVYGEKTSPAVAASHGRRDAKAAASPFYAVKSGDTLTGIAAQHHVTVADLKKWNGQKLAGGLQSGSQLVVSPQAAPAAKSSAPTRVAAQSKVVKYKVRPGDNLTLIARKHDTTTDEILKLNGLKSPKVVPGAILLVRKPR